MICRCCRLHGRTRFHLGYNALARYTGASALESARLHRPDLVLLDLAMQCMDGFQFARLFRELPECGTLPIIAVTGCSSQVHDAQASEAGIRHCLLKPICLKRLKDLLAGEIERFKASRRDVKDRSGTPFANSYSPVSL